MGNLNLKFSNSNEYLIVSGSNISLLNGIYVKSGTVSEKPKYVKTPAVNYLNNGNFQIIIQGEFPIVWGITTVSYNGYFYYGNSSYASPDLVPAWGIGQNGSGNISIKVTAIGKTSIKKQNINNLYPYELDNFRNLYIFKGGTVNTIGAVFNKDNFIKGASASSSDQLRIFLPQVAAVSRR